MNQLQKVPEKSTFSLESFEHAQRVAKMLAASDLIPSNYRNNIQNVMVAMEMANRIQASPLMVMQNLFIIQGKPSWSSSFIIAAINSCGKFSPLRFEFSGEGDSYGCTAWAMDKELNQRIEGPKVTLKMAKEEGWISKPGSKWKTMPELMLRYRAAAFFGRLYSPEILMGMHSVEEMADVYSEKVDKEAERVKLMIEDAQTMEELEKLRPHLKNEELTNLFNSKIETLRK